MYIIYDPLFLKHDPGAMHPETSSRLTSILDSLKDLEEKNIITITLPGEADPDIAALVHTRGYIDTVKNFSKNGGYSYIDGDTVVSEHTYSSAMLAATGAARGIDLVFDDQGPNVYFAMVRPPGHHAFKDHGGGFCIFNNVAVAASYALERYGLERVAIIDFDGHHGNGTQDIFYRSEQVFFISLHQYPHYPGTGYYDQTGDGRGRGYNLNIPFPPDTGGESYIAAFSQLILPLLEKYEPQLILVSAGYDSHSSDELTSLGLSTSSYLKIMYLISSLSLKYCQGRMGIVLEGGYNTGILGPCVRKTILGSPPYAKKHAVEIENIMEAGRQKGQKGLLQDIKSVWGFK